MPQENQCQHTLDAVFREDEPPWIEYECDGALIMMHLRRTALSLFALFRSVTQRSDERRPTRWRDILRGWSPPSSGGPSCKT